MLIREMDKQFRPREKLAEKGVDALGADELVAILLRTGTKGTSVIAVAQDLLREFGTLNTLAQATVDELRRIKGIGPDKAVTLIAAFKLARLMAQEIQESALLESPGSVADLMREDFREQSVETFFVVLLNTRRRLIRKQRISQGTLDTLLVHPREVFRAAISANAAALILAHNHPSGDPTPSEADIKVTRDLIRAGQLLRIDVLDHVIVGRPCPGRDTDFVSLRELGYFYS